MNVALIGCGRAGRKRATALAGARLVAAVDVDRGRAEALAGEIPGAQAGSDWRAAVTRDDVDIVVVSTPHDQLAPIATAAVERGKHVLVEKPAARSTAELDLLAGAAARSGALVRVGFNHRYHPALREARRLVDDGALGDLMYVRGRYGHGGRLGYESEWRSDAGVAGGGQLLDQGMHLIDLARWFLGDFVEVDGAAQTFFWERPVDDNAFLLLHTAEARAAFLHTSCTEWKNLFSFDVHGRGGALHVDGLGGSYGVERLTHHRMSPEMGPPQTTVREFPGADDSWAAEFAEFLRDIREARPPSAGLADARAALSVAEKIYARSRR